MATKRTRGARTEEERAERRARDRDIAADAVAALKSSEGWRRWLEVRRRFHDYSLGNTILIAWQRPGATRVAGFSGWKKLGYTVRKGETGIRIWAPVRPSKKRMERWRREGADPDERPATRYRMVSVFDRTQVDPIPDFAGRIVDLEPPIAPVEGDGLAVLLAPLTELASSIGVSVVIGDVPPGAGGVFYPGDRKIGLLAVSSTTSPNAQVKTMIHEVAHTLLSIEPEDDDPHLTYAEEEVVVECVAFTVCAAVGLDTAGFSVPYLAGWSKEDEIARYAGIVDRVAGRIEDVVCRDLPDGEEMRAPLAA